MLWRFDHGELDGLHPRVMVLHIGTDNTGGTKNARQNSPAEFADAVREICERIHTKVPAARIILMTVFPGEEEPNHPRRAQTAQINRMLAVFTKTPGIQFLDIGPKSLNPEYRLKSDGKRLTITGGSDVGVLYGAYAFAEKLGVRFYLHGDAIPDEKIPFVLPVLDETHAPLFALRGLQPFHDFPEGPDWCRIP